MRIYRQAMKDSVMYSKCVSITRVSDISADSATLYTYAGGHASYKKGDIAVWSQDKLLTAGMGIAESLNC